MVKKKHAGGRPLKFKNLKVIKNKIDAYFKSCWTIKLDMFGAPIYMKDKNGKKTNNAVMVQTRPYTITGLGLALYMTRQMLLEYQDKDKFGDTIKRAKQMCHNYAEESLYMGKNPTGAIFNLKNNYGWKDKMEVESEVIIKPTPILGEETDVILKNNSNKKAPSSN